MRSAIGSSVLRLDGASKVSGEAIFCDDVRLPGLLWGKILRSPHPHARILRIDTNRARRLRGVKAVITGDDTLKKMYGVMPDEYPLAVGKVRYVGDEIAAVAAIDEEVANEALGLIDVEYEILKPVFDPVAAMDPGAPKIHDADRNIARLVQLNFGDIEQGFAASDYVFEDRFETKMVSHCPLETHCAVGCWDASGKLTIWSTTQAPFLLRMTLAETLGLSVGSVRVIKPRVGGAFGGKRDMMALDFCAALLAMKAGRPVKINYSREEEFISGRQRHPMIIELKTGAKKEGTLLAKQCKVIMDNGAYNSRGPTVIGSCSSYITILYRIPNIKFEGYLVYTNNPVGGAMRGFGNPQIRFADDSQMDMIAERLRIDPVEIRLRNARQTGDVTPNKVRLRSCGLKDSIIQAAEKARFRDKWRKLGPYRGIGIACGHHTCGFKDFLPHDSSAATLKINEDGLVDLMTGGADVGQGLDTVMAQIAAAELGISPGKISVLSGDTGLTPMDLGSWGSRGTFIAGRAVQAAAFDAKRQIFEIVAEHLEADPADLLAGDGKIFVKGAPAKSITFEDAIAECSNSGRGVSIIGRGYYNTPCEKFNRQTGEGDSSPGYSFGTQVIEVEVDPETGRILVKKIAAAIDCGVAINPLSIEGQVEGSILGGMGQATMEELLRVDGKVFNSNFLDYKMPLSEDVPEIETIVIETMDPEGPFGAKGVGEFVQIPTAAAVANALYDALGVRFKTLPITRDMVLGAIEEKKLKSHSGAR